MNEQVSNSLRSETPGFVADTGFTMVSGDIEIFKLLYEYRLLRREHISVLTGRDPKRVHRRLRKLFGLGYLSRIVLPQQKHIYAVGKAAQPVLVEEGTADPELLDSRLRYHELKPFFLNHEMAIVDFHVTLALATRENVLRLVSWREGNALYDSVTVRMKNESAKLPIRPDAFFTIEDLRRPAGANHANFFLEADRATTRDHGRFMQKLRAYWHYLEQGLHERKFAIKHFRVLTVTKTRERAKNLAKAASAVLPERARKYFLFTWSKNVSLEQPDAILDDVYINARTADRDRCYPLVSEPSLQFAGAE